VWKYAFYKSDEKDEEKSEIMICNIIRICRMSQMVTARITVCDLHKIQKNSLCVHAGARTCIKSKRDNVFSSVSQRYGRYIYV